MFEKLTLQQKIKFAEMMFMAVRDTKAATRTVFGQYLTMAPGPARQSALRLYMSYVAISADQRDIIDDLLAATS